MKELKNSGISWVGKCPTHWQVMRNKYIMHKIKHIPPSYQGEAILSLSMKGVIVRDLEAGGKMPSSFNGYQTLYPGNLLMCLFDYDVTPRCIGLIKNYGVSSPAYSQFELDNGNVASYFYYYYLMVDNEKSILHLAKNLRHSFTEEQLGCIEAPVPPVKEQQAIASFLDEKCTEIDALVEDIQAEISTLEELKKSIITEAVTKGLNPNVEMKNSGIEWIGKCPKHWNILKIRDSISSIESGVSVNAANYPAGDNEIGVLKTSCVSKYIFDASENKAVNKNEENRVSCPVKKGCIVVSRMNTPDLVGACGYVSDEVKGIYLPDRLWQVHVKSPYSAQYITYYLMSHIARSYYASIAVGTSSTMQNISQKEFGCMFFCVPEIAEQQAIADYLDAKCDEIEATIAEKKEQLSTLTEYKKSLIYEYVTGKKEVPQK